MRGSVNRVYRNYPPFLTVAGLAPFDLFLIYLFTSTTILLGKGVVMVGYGRSSLFSVTYCLPSKNRRVGYGRRPLFPLFPLFPIYRAITLTYQQNFVRPGLRAPPGKATSRARTQATTITTITTTRGPTGTTPPPRDATTPTHATTPDATTHHATDGTRHKHPQTQFLMDTAPRIHPTGTAPPPRAAGGSDPLLMIANSSTYAPICEFLTKPTYRQRVYSSGVAAVGVN